jgi:hypothetical protein
VIDSNAAERNMVFVSHANPEDNEFAMWLSLQLASNGYPVWCDLTKLLGGEDFWDDIQHALANRTIKFIFVLSRISNKKDGALQELAYAKTVAKKLKDQIKDFIVTVRLDDIPFDDIDIRVHRQNHIPFYPSWAQGLAQLLKKLEDDAVPKRVDFNPEAVCSWWRDQFSANQGVVEQPEELLSNWFTVEDLPSKLSIHVLRPKRVGPVDFAGTSLPYPSVWINDASFLTFAKAEDFADSLGDNLIIDRTEEISLGALLVSDGIKDGPKHLAQILRLAWDQRLARALPAYEMATGQRCFYFKSGTVTDDSLDFLNADGKKGWRGVVGYKSVGRDKKRIWHFGISGKPIIRPETLFLVKSHVLFSDDGKTLWANKDAMARARRNQCRNWWNDDWRDRMLATMSHLAADDTRILFALGSDVAFALSKLPILFGSPVAYNVVAPIVKEELSDYEFEDEDLDELHDEVAIPDEAL